MDHKTGLVCFDVEVHSACKSYSYCISGTAPHIAELGNVQVRKGVRCFGFGMKRSSTAMNKIVQEEA